ncbi:MAG TPA: 2-hydroxychromene-2-carboxylate isomerase [Ideonella sp.]|uniref:2-hydroxychromene-2-carboxylate isomerase n=1 Tax=Ideonella sp. TaxID=1929293 RepID=UPI002B8E96AD|nr:2-hydroxychromene-2-carboxylate isomerase [Ideonella sp.]HSI48618.1 2-hydroxychromene-2-carboxylate isomerase [Ideonella sp.]
MSRVIDYHLAPHSPWTCLGHDRFVALARAHGASIRVRPIDLGKVFPVSGGLPLAQRAPQRQAYRLVELRRISKSLGLPMVIEPKFFPVATGPASLLIIAVDLKDGTEAALRLSGALLNAVWVQERNIADTATLAALLAECRLPAERLAESTMSEVAEVYERYSREAIDAQVFGAPSYVLDGEIFWGQDRLDLLAEALADTTRGA